jgi:starvation-inducible DNA-binding protein
MELSWNGFRFVGAVVDDTKETNLIDQLKILLADVSVFYHAIHEFHWNVKGSDFYQYHKFYDELVSDIYDSIDPIAENIRKLGGSTDYKMSDLLKITTLEEPKEADFSPESLTKTLIGINSSFIETLKTTFAKADQENEQGVANFIAERIDMHQKWNWFLKSSVGE